MTYIRTDWNYLSSADRQSFADAVKAMKKLSETDPDDPRGWTYQANVHGLHGSIPPANAQYWAQCQHQTYFFLSWHRMYIWYFEQILCAVGPDPYLALPYWNYTDTPHVRSTRALPTEFYSPGDDSNPLYVEDRNTAINEGGAIPESDVRYDIAYSFTDFYSSRANQARWLALAFGGVSRGPNHFGLFNGQLENQPHNVVHDQVGGLMSDPNTAAQDPIFWLHHSNIDRLWEGWLSLFGGRRHPQPGSGDPAADKWLQQVFYFHNGNGNPVQLTGAQVLDTATQLDYMYDKLPPAPLTRRSVVPSVTAVSTEPAGSAPSRLESTGREPRPVGRSRERGFKLDNVRTVGLSLDAPSALESAGAAILSRARPAAPRGPLAEGADGKRVVLALNGMRVKGLARHTYEVYLNLPEGTPPDHRSIYYVGNIGIFTHAQRDDGDGGDGGHDAHAGHGGNDAHATHGGDDGGGHQGHGDGQTHVAFDVTDVVADLQAQGEWDPAGARVTFVVSSVEAPGTASAALESTRRPVGEHYQVDQVALHVV